jgi:uncharacterized GH25 family protein
MIVMNRKFILLAALLVFQTIAMAHEFWLRPKKFRYAVGEEAKIDFVVGENFNGEYWDLSVHKVEKLELITNTGRRDLTTSVKSSKGNNLTYKIASQGTHLFALRSNKAMIELDAEKFNAYLEEDGIENIIQLRKKNNETDKPAKERYQRFAKLLLQGGSAMDEVYKRNVGFPLEIIPATNPYRLRSGDYLSCKVIQNNKPLAHQMVKVWSIVGNRSFLQNMYTENDGTIKFPLSSKGPWMVSTVTMEEVTDGDVDYESTWASLVFGIEQ